MNVFVYLHHVLYYIRVYDFFLFLLIAGFSETNLSALDEFGPFKVNIYKPYS
jgi:hypothetical protein